MKKLTPVSENLKKLPTAVRPIVTATRRMVKAVAPDAVEVAYQSGPPRSTSYMWKLVRYTVDGRYVLGIGTFPKYSTLIFYRGRELDDEASRLQGSGKDSRFLTLRSAADANRPTVKRLVREAFRLGGA
ncbi:MAG: DUF1801 domain-containing protein [Candidatus Dormibacteraeota bacterium]|nr:DUF1801 domain-containing protein [Candidatus Dormibacteraeota bacterium]MDQ6900244.1 DUF1801 domain-containing protein [Candidatus Dormibacteraeota bacterium]